MLIMPRFKELWSPKPVRLGCSVKGEFKITMRDANGKYLWDTGWFDNLITNNGLENLGEGASFMSFFCVGSGTTPANNTDETIETFMGVGGTGGPSTVNTNGGSPLYAHIQVIGKRFGAGVATGTINELTLGTQNNGTDISVRQIISPAIVKGPTQIMDITHKNSVFRDHVAPTYPTGTIDISGTTYNYEVRAAEVNIVSNGGLARMGSTYNVLHACTGELVDPSVTGTGSTVRDSLISISTSFSEDAYVPGSHQKTGDVIFDVTRGNDVLGIRSIMFGDLVADWIDWQGGAFQRKPGWIVRYGNVSGDTTIPKTEDNELILGCVRSWRRYP